MFGSATRYGRPPPGLPAQRAVPLPSRPVSFSPVLAHGAPSLHLLSRGSVAIRPYADVIRLQREPDPVLQSQRVDEITRQLQSACPVEYRVLLRLSGLAAVLVGRGPAQYLRADPAVPDRDRPVDLFRHCRVVRHDEHGDADLGIDLAEASEDLVGCLG